MYLLAYSPMQRYAIVGLFANKGPSYATDRLQISWPTTEHGINGETLYFSGLPPPQFASPRPAAKSMSPRSPRVKTPNENGDGPTSPQLRAGPASASDPLMFLSSPFGLSSSLRSSISAAEQVHASLLRPLKQDAQVQHDAQWTQPTHAEALPTPSTAIAEAQRGPRFDLSHGPALSRDLDGKLDTAGHTLVAITVGTVKNLDLFNAEVLIVCIVQTIDPDKLALPAPSSSLFVLFGLLIQIFTSRMGRDKGGVHTCV